MIGMSKGSCPVTSGTGRGSVSSAVRLLACTVVLLAAVGAAAEEPPEDSAAAVKKQSPWLVLPTLSSNPKLGTSVGLMASYLHYFDEKSKVSMFAVNAQYTSTHSAVGAIIANTSFGADHHRVLAVLAAGRIKNDYDDFLGTGQPLKTEDNLNAFVARYLYRVKGDWFAGFQGLLSNYQIIGQTALDEEILNILGLTGLESGGLGATVTHDSRDNQNSPTGGWVLNLNNVAYREWIAGEENYDVYRLDMKGYWEHGGGKVFAVRQNNHWSVDAPPSASASVSLRGYKSGQYLGKYQSSLEVEERIRFGKKWGATVFAGIACLYGDGSVCTDSENLYPSYGAGLQYVANQKEGIVLNLEFAAGKSDNYGFYLKMGYGY